MSSALLLSSLPKGYDTHVTSLESRKEEEITFSLLQQRIISEYERRLHAGNGVNEAVLRAYAKPGGVCYFCKSLDIKRKIVTSTNLGNVNRYLKNLQMRLILLGKRQPQMSFFLNLVKPKDFPG